MKWIVATSRIVVSIQGHYNPFKLFVGRGGSIVWEPKVTEGEFQPHSVERMIEKKNVY